MKIKHTYLFVPALVLAGLIAALIFYFVRENKNASDILLITLIVGTLPLAYRMFRALLKGRFGIDIIAILAIAAAFFLKEYLAGTVILLMLSGGEALEDYALRRARKELASLISNAPSVAHVKQAQGIKDIPAGSVKIGDLIVIKPGEVVPVDGLVISGASEVDESALTGESLPVEKKLSSLLLSGSVNKENILEIKALRIAAESQYEQIIKLVKEAEESRAPFVRLADRYSVWFTIVTLLLGALSWLLAHDPVRLLAVLVVATPCPLILATPIALISGISKSARRGIVVKSGGALEKLAGISAFIFDKTGTLTLGAPEVTGIHPYSEKAEDVLKIAASLDQLSAHVLARSLLRYFQNYRNLKLTYPENFQEAFGDGVKGEINRITYYFGKLDFLRQSGISVPQNILKEHEVAQRQGKISVYLGSNGRLLGVVYFADTIRPEIKRLFQNVKAQGVKKIVMLTGDKKSVAENIAKQLHLDDIHAECLPKDKVAEVKDHQRQFGSVAMVGDGINDAPALAAADIGIAMGAHGSTASSDSSDIVITVDNLERVGEALAIAKYAIFIAKQGIFIGISLSIFMMVFAALGFIRPVYGALLQEILDVAVIFNALRVNFGEIKNYPAPSKH